MLFIYYLLDGEIYQASIPEKSLEEYFGRRTEEMSTVFGALYLEYDNYTFYNFYKYKVNLETKTLELRAS